MAATATASPYARGAPELAKLGYHTIPVMPGEKAPGEFKGGRWVHMSQWQRFRDQKPSSFQHDLWIRNYPDANIGLILGAKVGQHQLIAVDVDADDYDTLRELLACLPVSPMAKRGKKGETRFYLAPFDIKTRAFNGGDGRRVVDLLTGQDTRQTVVPPSIHPDTGEPYVWLHGPVELEDLPVFDGDALAVLEETLRGIGWNPDAQRSRPVQPPPSVIDPDDYWTEVKSAAMADMDAWVPHLGLYACRRARGGYEAVAHWRASSTGQPMEKRKRNLSIQPNGIKDFGTNDTFSPIDLVMAARGVDQTAATIWLRSQLGLIEEGVIIAFPAVGNPTSDAGPGAVPGPEPAKVVDELPEAMTRQPGLLGAITDWIADSSRRPQRGLALAAACTILGTAAGRKYAGPTRSGTHLYVLGLARTSAGKDHALQQIARVLNACGMSQHLGPSQFMSLSAVVKRLNRAPLTLSPMDEFGSFLARINNRRASPHERAITGVLRTAWGSSFQTMSPPEWANGPSDPIHSPALSIYGVSTPEELYASLEGADVHNGFLNRFLLVSTRVKPRDRDPKVDAFTVPDDIKRGLHQIYGAGAALMMATSHNGIADGPMITALWADDAAKAAYQKFVAGIEHREAEMAFLGRTAEMAVRLATIRAIGVRPDAPRVNVDDIQWGCDLALWSGDRMIAETSDYMADTQNQADAQRVVRVLKERGRIKHGDLVRAMQHRMKASDLKAILGSLAEAGQIRVELERPPSGGTETRWYAAS